VSAQDHLDLDQLADVLAGQPEPAHLAECLGCRGRLEERAADLPLVSRALAEAPVPEMPADLPARLLAAVAAERPAAPPQADVLPLAGRGNRGRRWLPGASAVAAAAVLVVGGVLLFQRDDDPQADSASSAAGYAVNDSGTNYTRSGVELQSRLPAILQGTASAKSAAAPEAAQPTPATALRFGQGTGTLSGGSAKDNSRGMALPGDPLAGLRTTTGLATCLNSLTDPGDTGIPLALDYATFEGTPALVVVLPTKQADKVDVFVVPAGCAKADGNVLYFRRLPRP
jgi:hypothetical protein